jgi:transposase
MFCRRHLCLGKKRGLCVGKTKRGKGTKLMVLVDGKGTPLGIHVASATPAEVKLLAETLRSVPMRRLRGRPQRLIADRAYDSNAARRWLTRRRIAPIIPARRNNRSATHQDGRSLRRFRRRWIIERTNAWLQNFRRVVVRYERHVRNYAAFVHFACALIALRRVLG